MAARHRRRRAAFGQNGVRRKRAPKEHKRKPQTQTLWKVIVDMGFRETSWYVIFIDLTADRLAARRLAADRLAADGTSATER